uniref:Uncharacterized protein n=1 Tax=Siphoviridae sp. ctLKT1 TaxID=2825451 RepID=A0A8S5U7Q3_9CAUD|nr:MAG TPA: hypothetical protein [Siphoviridae sp. ctLKT1]
MRVCRPSERYLTHIRVAFLYLFSYLHESRPIGRLLCLFKKSLRKAVLS